MEEQDLLADKGTWDGILALVPDEEIRQKCDAHWLQKGAGLSSIKKWMQLVGEIESKKVCTDIVQLNTIIEKKYDIDERGARHCLSILVSAIG